MPKGNYRGVSLRTTLVGVVEARIKNDKLYKSIAEFVSDATREKLSSDKVSDRVRIPKPMLTAVDKIVEDYTHYYSDREQFVQQAIRDLIMRAVTNTPQFSSINLSKIAKNDVLSKDECEARLRDTITEIAKKENLKLTEEQIKHLAQGIMRQHEELMAS